MAAILDFTKWQNYKFKRCETHYYASVLLAVVVSVCVCLSHAGIVSKRLNLGSHK